MMHQIVPDLQELQNKLKLPDDRLLQVQMAIRDPKVADALTPGQWK